MLYALNSSRGRCFVGRPFGRPCCLVLSAALVGIGAVQNAARADPLPGEVLKFQQLPLDGGVPIIAPYPGPFIAPNPFPIPGGGIPTPVTPFPGHDELSTANANLFNTQNNAIGWQGVYKADDFADRFDSPVVHVRWWGSYMNNGQVFGGVKQFLISFESDVPLGGSNPLPFSHPGTPLLNQIVTKGPLAPASGTFTEAIVPGAAVNPLDGPLYQYNAELTLPFGQLHNTVYWLKIVALVDPARDGPIQWGWHDRDWAVPDLEASIPLAVIPGEGVAGLLPGGAPVWHFQDDAVSGGILIGPGIGLPPGPLGILQDGWTPQFYIDGIDGPTGIGAFSKDLAFELYTVPEPTSIVVLAAGAALLLRRKRSA